MEASQGGCKLASLNRNIQALETKGAWTWLNAFISHREMFSLKWNEVNPGFHADWFYSRTRSVPFWFVLFKKKEQETNSHHIRSVIWVQNLVKFIFQRLRPFRVLISSLWCELKLQFPDVIAFRLPIITLAHIPLLSDMQFPN